MKKVKKSIIKESQRAHIDFTNKLSAMWAKVQQRIFESWLKNNSSSGAE